jgi:hypothetical protein
MTLSRGPPGLCTLSRPGNPGSRLKPGSPSRLIGRSSTPQNEFVPLYAFYIRDRLRIPRNNFHPKFSSRISLDQVYLLDHLPLLDQPGFPGCPILSGSPRSLRFPLLQLLYKQSAKRTPRRLVPTIAAISPHHILDLVKTTGLIEGVVN